MLDTLNLFAPETAKIVTVYFLQIIILLATFRLLISSITDLLLRDKLQKIIGGFIVFNVAILADVPWIYFLSLFIGGLIIASEDFMKFLFALWRSESNQIHKTIQSLTPVSLEEYKKKNDNEIKEITEKANLQGKDANAFRERYKIAEKKVNEFFEKKYGDRYVQMVRVNNQYGSKMFDAVIQSKVNERDIFTSDELKGRTDLSAQYIVEIKFFKHTNVDSQVHRLVQELCFLDFISIYKIVLVFDEVSENEADKIYSKLTTRYKDKLQFQFYIFSIAKDNKLSLLRGPDESA